MLEWIISSAVLLAAVIAVRYALRGRLRPGVQYAMWAIVLVRLLVPVSFGSGAYSAGTAAAALEQTPAVQAVLTPSMDYDAAYSQVAREYAGRGLDVSELPPRQQQAMDREIRALQRPTAVQVLQWVWLGGMAAMALTLTGTNLRLYIRLRRSRRELTREGRMPVYVTEAVDTPCLFGLVRPAVYLTPEAAGDDVTRQHSVAHELTHLRHGDHVWSLLRCVCLAVHWYDPLVWWAAVLSRRDAELACDDATIRRLGEEQGRVWPDPGADDLPQAWKSAGNGYHHDRWGRGDPGAHPLHCEAPTHHRVHCCGTGAGGGGSGRVRLYRFRPEGRAQNADAGHQSAG